MVLVSDSVHTPYFDYRPTISNYPPPPPPNPLSLSLSHTHTPFQKIQGVAVEELWLPEQSAVMPSGKGKWGETETAEYIPTAVRANGRKKRIRKRNTDSNFSLFCFCFVVVCFVVVLGLVSTKITACVSELLQPMK